MTPSTDTAALVREALRYLAGDDCAIDADDYPDTRIIRGLLDALSQADEAAKRAVTEEREACAKIAGSFAWSASHKDSEWHRGQADAAMDIESAIRSRSLNAGKQEAGE